MLKKVFYDENMMTFYFINNNKIKGTIFLDFPKKEFLYPEFKESINYFIYNGLCFKNKKYFKRAILFIIDYCKKFNRKGIVFFFEYGDKSLIKNLLDLGFVQNGEFYIYEY